MSSVELSYVYLRLRHQYSVNGDAVLVDSTARRGFGLRISHGRGKGSNNVKALFLGEVLFRGVFIWDLLGMTGIRPLPPYHAATCQGAGREEEESSWTQLKNGLGFMGARTVIARIRAMWTTSGPWKTPGLGEARKGENTDQKWTWETAPLRLCTPIWGAWLGTWSTWTGWGVPRHSDSRHQRDGSWPWVLHGYFTEVWCSQWNAD